MLSMDVPIMVFHMAKLQREREQSNSHNRQVGSRTEEETMHTTHIVMMLGFLEAWSLPVTLKAVPRGLYT